ncbi:MAG: hypothetical protein Kow0088_15060 [Anaerolineales bacterium]
MPGVFIAIPLKELQPYGVVDAEQDWVLSFRGHVIPFWIIDNGQPTLTFYSPPTRNPYWRENVFLLQPKETFSLSPDPELSTLIYRPKLPANLGEQLPPGTGLAYFALEENLIYQSLSEGDHWYWLKLINQQEETLPLRLEAKPSGEVILRFILYSATEAPAHPDHALRLSVNDGFSQELVWDGKGLQIIETTIAAEAFHQGDNQLTLLIPNLEGVFAQVSYLDRIEVFFPQKLSPQIEQEDFFVTGSLEGLIQGNASVGGWVWQVEDALAPRRIEYEAGLPTSDEIFRYHWVSENGFRSPTSLQPLQYSALETTLPAEVTYLAIGTDELLKPLQPLLELRQAEGLTVQTIEVQEIYDQYYGFAEPQAIRAYLLKVARLYPSLRYVLLVGDATYEPSDSLASKKQNRLPTFFIDTIFGGQTASEMPFAILDEADPQFLTNAPAFQPKLAVGRLPASSPQQVRQWVNKVLEYEKGQRKPHRKAVLAVADPQEAHFAYDAATFLELWKEPTTGESFLPEVGEIDLEQKMQEIFKQDYQMIAYFGHGAIDLWGKDEIFTAQEAKQIGGQASYPLVLNFTCLTGYYIHPEVLSLTEALLWNPKGGAVVVIAPTSLTLAEDQSFLWRALVESYQNAEKARIGDVWLAALPKIVLSNQGVRDVVLTYTLFGDPALTLP